jgi:hypothetical protein
MVFWFIGLDAIMKVYLESRALAACKLGIKMYFKMSKKLKKS